MSDYISKSALISRFKQLQGSDTLANMFVLDVIKEVKKQPTLSETEIIRKAFERVVERLEEETIALEDNYGDLVECVPKDIAIEIVKEEGEIDVLQSKEC